MKKMIVLAAVVIAMVMLIGAPGANAAADLNGVAYIQGHGGHIAVLDLKTGAAKRIVHGKPSDALTISADKKTIYAFSLDGNSKEINLETGAQTEWAKLGKKHCGSNIAPDGTVWVSDMADGHVYVYDPKTKKLADSFPVSKSTCAITFSKDGKLAYVSDMPGGFTSIVDVKTKKVIDKIEGTGNYIHRGRVNPAGTELWQSDGNELKGGKPAGVGYVDAGGAAGSVTVVDLKSKKVVDSVYIGGNVHDVDFTPDGKYAVVATRQYPVREDSSLMIVDTKTKRVVKSYSACQVCHSEMGITIKNEVDGGRPFLCAVQVDWTAKGLPKAAQ